MEWSLTGVPLPIVLRPPSPLTDDELIAFSLRNKPYRIERNTRGELEIITPVGYRGGRHELFVARELDLWAEADGRGEASGPNTGFNLADGSTLSPDASWVSHEQLAPLTEEQRSKYPPLCPQFVIEVRSESDRLAVLQAKMHQWLENGAQLAWLIDPLGATLTVYRPGRQSEVLVRPDRVEAGPPVPGFVLQASRLWT